MNGRLLSAFQRAPEHNDEREPGKKWKHAPLEHQFALNPKRKGSTRVCVYITILAPGRTCWSTRAREWSSQWRQRPRIENGELVM